MVGHFEGFASTPRRGVAPDQLLVNLEVGLKIERIAGSPFLLAREGGEKFAAEYAGIFLRHGARLGFF